MSGFRKSGHIYKLQEFKCYNWKDTEHFILECVQSLLLMHFISEVHHFVILYCNHVISYIRIYKWFDWYICLNSSIRQSCSFMPEYTKLQYTIEVYTTKLNTYNVQYKYNLQYNTYNIQYKYVQHVMTTIQLQCRMTTIQLQYTL